MTKLLTTVSLILALVACGGDSSPTSPTGPPPPPPKVPAKVEMTLGDADVSVWTIYPPQARLTFPLTLKETAGTAVNVNFIGLRIRWIGRADYENQIGASKIIEALGTNHINARGTLSGVVSFIIPLHSNLTGISVTVGMTDEYGNDVTVSRATGSLSITRYNRIANQIQ